MHAGNMPRRLAAKALAALFAIAIALLRWLFPGDTKTLAVLRGWYDKAKSAVTRRKERKAAEKNQDAQESCE